MKVTYLDNNATTRPAPEVVEATTSVLAETYGNPSSSHVLGQRAAFLVEEARQRVASCLGAHPSEIVFTSGGTESDNLAIRGVLKTKPEKRHIIISEVEHEAVFLLAIELEQEGYQVTRLKVDRQGRLNMEELRSALGDETALVSLMWANNETGVLFPIEEIANICRERGVPFHTDAVQAVGKIKINLHKVPLDLLSLSAHKFHGPKGVGALFVRRGLKIQALIIGGNQERQLRSGTENVPGIVGLGITAQLAQETLQEVEPQVQSMRDQMEQRLLDKIPSAQVIGAESPRLPNTSYACFEGTTAESILLGLSEKGICASGGSACHSGSIEPSRVLQAMGIDPQLAIGAVRLSLSRYTTAKEIDHLVDVLPGTIDKLKSLSKTSSCPSCSSSPNGA